MAASFEYTPQDKTIRRIRKKLRQIDNLELADRDLNEEERIKVSRKTNLRRDLQKVLKEYRPDETDFMKRQGSRLQDEAPESKKIRNLNSDGSASEPEEESEEEEDLYPQFSTDPSSSGNSPSDSSTSANIKQVSTTPTKDSQTTPKQAPNTLKKSKEKTPDNTSTAAKQLQNASPSKSKGGTSENSSRTPKQEQAKSVVASIIEADQEGNDAQPVKKNKRSRKSAKGSPDVGGKKEKCPWRDATFDVYTLQGHNDLILSVDCTEEYILSGSRDTTVRVWRVGGVVEERSLRGHTSPVTAVAFLPHTLAAAVIAKYQGECGGCVPESAVVGVSGGLDCYLKIWDIISGESLGSVYTYNGITKLVCGDWGVTTGTEGGRLEFWSLIDKQRTAYIDAFQSQVSAMCTNGNEIYAGSATGEVGVWQVSPSGQNPTTLYMMEPDSPTFVSLRRLVAITHNQGNIYLGDSNPNIKVLAWRKNSVSRMVNHIGEVGMTDSLAVSWDDHLLAASYFVDSGCPSINVRSPDGRYRCTLVDGEEGRYLALAAARGVIVTAGHTLKAWSLRNYSDIRRGQRGSKFETIFPMVLRRMSLAPVESGTEDDTDWASSSEDEEEDRRRLMKAAGRDVEDDHNADSRWWCNVL